MGVVEVDDIYGTGTNRAGGTTESVPGNRWVLFGYVNNPDGFTAEAYDWEVLKSGVLVPPSFTGGIGLTDDDAYFATGLGHWVAEAPDDSIDRVSSPTPHAGSGVLRLRHSLFGPHIGPWIDDTAGYYAEPGDVLSFSCWLRADPGNASPGEYAAVVTLQTHGGSVDEWDSADGFATPINESGWTQLTVSGVSSGYHSVLIAVTFGRKTPLSATLSGSGSWVFQSIGLIPDPLVGITFRILASGFADPASTSCEVQIGGFGGGSAAQVGDLLLAAVTTDVSVGQSITPPAGWTAIRTDTGVGTNGCIQTCFWKFATSGDLAGMQTFTLAHASKATVVVGVYYGVDPSPIGATSASVSSSDEVMATPPMMAPEMVVDFLGAREATAAVMSIASVSGGRDRGGQSSSGGGGGFTTNLLERQEALGGLAADDICYVSDVQANLRQPSYSYALWTRVIETGDNLGAHIVPVTYRFGLTYCGAMVTEWSGVAAVGPSLIGSGVGSILNAPRIGALGPGAADATVGSTATPASGTWVTAAVALLPDAYLAFFELVSSILNARLTQRDPMTLLRCSDDGVLDLALMAAVSTGSELFPGAISGHLYKERG